MLPCLPGTGTGAEHTALQQSAGNQKSVGLCLRDLGAGRGTAGLLESWEQDSLQEHTQGGDGLF